MELLTLDISSSKVTGRAGLLQDLGAGGKRLRSLVFNDIHIATPSHNNNFLFDLPVFLPSLRVLELNPSNLAAITDEALQAIGKHANNLRRLKIGPTRTAGEVGLSAVMSLESLRVLELHGAHLKSKAELPGLPRHKRLHIVYKNATAPASPPSSRCTYPDDLSDDDDLDIMDLFM